MDEIHPPSIKGYDFTELNPDEYLQVLPLDHMYDAHMASSPTFIFHPSDTQESFMRKIEYFHPVYYAAKSDGHILAYIRAEFDGETFIRDTPGYIHVKGAFCLPEHRGKGLHDRLLYLLVNKLKSQGYTRLGVDFESINPAANGFWLKHFTAYTHSVVRRIDEHAIK
jgi:GNAT superfamily N-acetyltransferase